MPGVLEVCLFGRSVTAYIDGVVKYLCRSKISYCLSCPESAFPELLWSIGRYHEGVVIIEEYLAVSRELYMLFDITSMVSCEFLCNDEERGDTIRSDVIYTPLLDILVGEYLSCIECRTACRGKSGTKWILFLIIVAQYLRSESETVYLERPREIGLYFVVYGQWSDSRDGLDLESFHYYSLARIERTS